MSRKGSVALIVATRLGGEMYLLKHPQWLSYTSLCD